MKEWLNKIILGDCMELMKKLPDKCIDTICTDPPYFRIVSNAWDRQWPSLEEFVSWVGEIGREFRRILRPNGSLIWFGDEKVIAYCQVELDKYFSLVNSLVWEKPGTQAMKGWRENRSFATSTERALFYEQNGGSGMPATGLEMVHSNPSNFATQKKILREAREKFMAAHGMTKRKECEDFLTKLLGHTGHCHYFSDSQWQWPNMENWAKMQAAGWELAEYEAQRAEYEAQRAEYEAQRAEYEAQRRPWNPHEKATDVLHFMQVAAEFHPTQKPLPLWCWLLERITRPGHVVFDPFSGSGTTAIACHKLGLNFICCERDAEYHAASVARLEKERAQGRLELFAQPKWEQASLL